VMADLRIGSRGSKLALWQARHVSALLESRGHQVSIVTIETTGDRIADAPFAQVGSKGMFLKEIEEALLQKRVDLAVHSLKDIPTDIPRGLELVAILPREDARDAFLSVHHASVMTLPLSARVGTSSLRRQAQMRVLRPDLKVEELRGNVDTRVLKLQSGEYDAILLAAAGVKRLQLTEHVKEWMAVDGMCPAPGQGALALEIRDDDPDTRHLLAQFDDHTTRAAVECERAALRRLGGGCHLPVGAHAVLDGEGLHLTVVVARPDGSEILRDQRRGREPHHLGEASADALLLAGARRILDELEGGSARGTQT